MDRPTLLKAAALQAAAVAVLSILLAAITPAGFFEDHGWWAGPAAWAVCALITAGALRLPRGPALVGAALAGIPSLLAQPLGLHWLGALLAVVVFAAWCARLAHRPASLPTGAVSSAG